MSPIIATAVMVLLGTATNALGSIVDPPNHVPEPSLLVMVASGIGGGILWVRNRRSK
jgi:hypothetical protein